MNDKEFLIKYEELLNKDYCNCNEMNCIDNNSPRRILNIAKQLQEENKQFKDNWDKLKEWLENNWIESQDIWFVKIINKMQELEQGSDKEC